MYLYGSRGVPSHSSVQGSRGVPSHSSGHGPGAFRVILPVMVQGRSESLFQVFQIHLKLKQEKKIDTK